MQAPAPQSQPQAQSSAQPSLIAAFHDYTRSFLAFAGARIWPTLALLLLAAGLESVGIVMVIPLVALFVGGNGGSWAGGALTLLHHLGFASRSAQLDALLAGFALLLVLRNAVIWLREVQVQFLSLGFIDHWRNRVVAALVRASWSGLLSVERSRIEFSVTSDVGRLALGTDRILRGSVNAIMLVTQIALALWLSVTLTLLVVLVLGIAALGLLPLIRSAQRLGQAITTEGRRRHNLLSDFLSGVKLAKAHNAERRYYDDFVEVTRQLRERLLAYQRGSAATTAAFQTASGAVACAAVVIGTQVTHTPTATLIALLLLLVRLSGPVLMLMQGAQSMANMVPAFRELERIERDLGETADANADAPLPLPVAGRPGAAIALDQVRLRRPDASEDALREISMTIGSGELVALLGTSGAGKTTLADVLTGLLPPSGGTIRVDGVPLDAQATPAWRGDVAYVPQDPFLFDHSLRENLLWMYPQASDAEIWAALEAAEAAEFVHALPAGLDTRMGERGQRLSGGERQRICLARALLRHPRLLILDEATNALDRPTELRLLASLARLRGRLSILMITHRLPAELPIDRVYKMEAGTLHLV